ncbi:MAG TPA: hypothetical protein VF796_13745, partial [Humisphaera sp.]
MTTFTEPTLGTPTPPPAAAPKPSAPALSPVDAQRAALRDLIALATESAATEARIDRELQAALKAAAETFERARQTIDARYAQQTKAAAEKHAAAVAAVRQKEAADAHAVRKFEAPAKAEAQGQFEQTQALANKKVQEAAWLADSDLEVTINALAADKKRLEEEVAGHLAELDATHAAAVQQAVTYGYQPTDADQAAAAAADKPAQELPGATAGT